MSRALLILTITLIGLGCTAEPAPEQEVLRPVRTERATTTGATRVRSFSGIARASQETNLSFRVRGRIVGLFVEVGDTVQANHLIAQLEQEDYRIAVRQETPYPYGVLCRRGGFLEPLISFCFKLDR